MGTHTAYFERIIGDDEDAVEVEVEFTLTGGEAASGMSGPPEFYDPGSAPEFTVEGAWIKATGEVVTLTDAEAKKVEDDVMDRLGDFDDGDDYPEDDR